MADFLRTLLQWLWEWRSKLAITLMVLFTVMIGYMIPVPGYDPRFSQNLSLFTVAPSAWVNAAVLVQLFSIAFSKKTLSSFGSEGFFRKSVMAFALIFALASGYAYSQLNYHPLTDSGSLPVILVTVSYVAGTVVYMFLGYIIERYGTGAGFWTLLWSGLAWGFSDRLVTLPDISQIGRLSELRGLFIWMAIGLVLLMVLSVTYRLNSKYSLLCWAWPVLVVGTVWIVSVMGLAMVGRVYVTNWHVPPAIFPCLLFLAIFLSLPARLPSLLKWISLPVIIILVSTDYFYGLTDEIPIQQPEPLFFILTAAAMTFVFMGLRARIQHNRHVKSLKL